MGLIKHFRDDEGARHEVHLDAIYDMVNNARISLRSLLAGKADTSALAGKADLSGATFTGRIYAAVIYAKDNSDGLYLFGNDDEDYPNVAIRGNGNIDLNADNIGGTAIANTSALLNAGGNKIPTAEVVKNALAGKANSSHTHSQSDVTGLATSLEGKVDANVDDTYGSVDTDNKINVANLVNGKMYRAYAADAFDGIAIRDMFNHTGSTFSFNNWVDDSTNVFMLLFRYYKLSTSIEGRYTHVIDIITYDVPTGPM